MPSKYLEYYKKEFNTIDEKYIKSILLIRNLKMSYFYMFA